jgi:hypothetical protein
VKRVAVIFRCCQDDDYLIDHFIDYYKKVGANLFIANFSYRFSEDEENFKEFVDKTTKKYPEIIYNIGPHVLDDGIGVKRTKELLETKQDIDYVIPADTDEFHEYKENNVLLSIDYLEKNLFDVLSGYTLERIPEDGSSSKEILSTQSIFEQFPRHNENLFVMPKISLIKKEYYKFVGCGHHYIDKKLIDEFGIKINDSGKTHHFRWSEEGKVRMEKWVRCYESPDWTGWKDMKRAQDKLDAFNYNLIDYKGPK